MRSPASERPIVIAHRGARAEAAENTMESFRVAIEIGADAIELDVHLSADGVRVIIHDATLDRTTDATGRVNAHRAGELADLGVPALSDVLALVDEQDRTVLVVELKWDDMNPYSRDDLAVGATAASRASADRCWSRASTTSFWPRVTAPRPTQRSGC